MKIKFIGTGSGKTELGKFHSSVLFETPDKKILIDAGDSISKALISSGERINSIDVIIFSHYHADHFAGAASLLTQMKLSDRTEPLKIFTHRKLIEPLKRFINYSYLFPEIFDFEFEIIGFEFSKKYSAGNSLKFIPARNSHISPQKEIENEFNVPFISSSFLFDCGGAAIFYTSDIGSSEDLYLFKSHKIDYFISEAAHVTVREIIAAAEFFSPKLCILTHFNDEDKDKIETEIKSFEAESDFKILTAEDSLEIDL